MDKQYIKGKDMDDLQERYPAAYHFLLDRVLRNEYLAVNNELLALERKCSHEQMGRYRWLLERETQLGQLFRLVASGDNSVTIERRPVHEFGQVDKYGNYIEQSELNEGHPGDPNEYGSST